MPYFHVVVKIKRNKKPICLFKDFSERELRKNFIKPYKLGEKFFYNNNILLVTEILNVKIVSTLQEHKHELKPLLTQAHKNAMNKANELFKDIIVEPSNSSTDLEIESFNDYEIEDCGVNVTSEFITEAPGRGTNLSKISTALKHPWVVRVFGVFGGIFLIYIGVK